MKRSIIFCMILMLCLQAFSGVAAYGAGNNLYMTYELPGGESAIYEGDEFQFKLKYSNQTDKDITDVKVDIIENASAFYWLYSQKLLLQNMEKGSGEKSVTFPTLYYKGKGQTLALKLTYKLGDTEISEDYAISIKQAHTSDTSSGSSGSSDAKNLVPKLGTASGNYIPTIGAGSSQNVSFPVKNSSIYQAKDVIMTLKMNDEAKAPLVLEDLDLRQRVDLINGNDVVPVTFNIRILNNAPSGVYAMKLSYSFNSAYGYAFDQSETVYIRVKNDAATPKLTVDNISVKQQNSSTVKLELKIKNLGNLPAKDVKLTLKGLKSGGFTTSNTDVKYLDKISGKDAETIEYILKVPASASDATSASSAVAAAASNDLSLKMDYKDDTGTAYSDENQIFVPVEEKEKAKPELAFGQIVSPQEVLSINKDFEVKFNLINNGGSAKKIKVSMTTDKEIVTKTLNPIYIEKMDAKANKTLSFKLFATNDAVTKNYPLAINVEYEDLFGGKYTATQYVGAYVENGTSSKTVPKIIVEKYSIDPSTVQAASDFNVKMSFLNTSRISGISNIKATVTSDDGTFTPTDSGNSFFIDRIPCKGSVARELKLHAKPDAEQKSYVLTVNFEYEDEKGNPYTSKETISVRVLQNARLQTGEIAVPTEAYAGQPLSIHVDFYNMGKSTLYNMMVKAKGNFTGEGLSYYVGNFASGSTDAFDTSITPASKGALSGNVIFSFEDANGKVTEITKEFSANVMEMPKQPMLDENGMPMGKGAVMVNGMPVNAPSKPGMLIYTIPAAVVIAGIITFIILRKRHKKRKELSLDE